MREHTLLVYIMGIKQVIIVVNKIDVSNDSKEKFKEIKEEITKFLKRQFKKVIMNCVDFSGFKDTKIVNRYLEGNPDKKPMQWYIIDTLLEALEKIKSPKSSFDKPFKYYLQDVYKISFHVVEYKLIFLNQVHLPLGSNFKSLENVILGNLCPCPTECLYAYFNAFILDMPLNA